MIFHFMELLFLLLPCFIPLCCPLPVVSTPLSLSHLSLSLLLPLLSVHCCAASHSAGRPVWWFWGPPCFMLPQCVVVFCLWELSCAMLLRPGPEPFPIVCCHMEASTNMEIGLSSCCSLTFSGTQLALNAEIIIIPITRANSVSSLCARGEGGRGAGPSIVQWETLKREVPHNIRALWGWSCDVY